MSRLVSFVVLSSVVRPPDGGQALNSRSDSGSGPSSYPTSFTHRKRPSDFHRLVTRPSRTDWKTSSQEKRF